MIKVLLRLVTCCILTSGLFGQTPSEAPRASTQPSYARRAELGFKRLFPGVAVLSGKLIVFGGHDRVGNGFHFTPAVESFDPRTNQVTRLPDMAHPRAFFGSAVVGDRIYVIGGLDPATPGGVSARVEVFDPLTGEWSLKAPLQVARSGLRAAVVGGKIYAFGGFGEDKARIFEVYDIATDTWTRLPDLPQPVLNPAVATRDGKVWVLGGGIPNGTKAEKGVQVLDPATNTWTQASTMIEPKGDHAIGILGNQLYVIAGWHDVIMKSVEALDLATMTWSRLGDLPDFRFFHGYATLDGRIYLLAGARGDIAVADNYTNTVDCYDPAQER